MILSVATTGPPFVGIGVCCGTRVAELVIDDKDVDDEEVKAVDPDSCEDRELWLIVWLKPALLV